MPTSMIVVDDFLNNPEDVRNAALQLEYPKLDVATYFPGRNSDKRLVITGIEDAISDIVGERLAPTQGTGHGKCRITLADDEGEGDVHIDPQSHWSGILYLTLPEHCEGGTDFFRHRPTNSDRAPLYPEELKSMGYSSVQELWDKLILPDSKDRSKWERTMRVPMRFNRLILLRPYLWHSSGPAFGNSIENGRLIHLLFMSGATAIG